ncbi:MarR family winged helix-turn-helix transcriptional regulator [Sandaracinobacteroides saxicola]|uniref:Winged helix-turn-helix transcriptional regulator n=1 Tax=Sandaracinobacteroides saxicola TaxID=2759707 RepID=A0A7G5IEI6_9SPHN|nr:MarR family winged helix-turn-helix transcriptional regulator [Sandaracinobacteroides saxicola]QMW21778.1 winged helix-turn-helix transcriptional regulator [Sandaracinobacteroides saxicola]
MLRLDDFLPYRLSLASNAVSAAIARVYDAQFGLKIPEWRVVAVLAEHAALTQAELCDRTAMDKMTISRAVTALSARRLATRDTDGTDRRARRVRLTAAGTALYTRVAPEALRMESKLLASLSPADVAHLTATLARLQQAASALDGFSNNGY